VALGSPKNAGWLTLTGGSLKWQLDLALQQEAAKEAVAEAVAQEALQDAHKFVFFVENF